MKKIICIVLSIIMIVSVCAFAVGCNEEAQEIRVVVPDGAPALAIARALDGYEFKGYNVTYEIVDGTNIAAKLTSKQADIAILPTNLGAKLYNSGVKIKMAATNVYGLLYLVGTQEITSVSSLKGEKILCTGQGGTPDFVLQHVLSQNGVNTDEVTIEYISQGSDAIATLKAGTAKFAVLGEPAATMAVNKAGAKVLFDLQAEWEKVTGTYGYPQACTVVTDELFAANSDFVKAFLKMMKENVEWIGENVTAVNEAIKKYNGKTSFASAAVIERCNIKYVGATDTEAKAAVESYLEIMKSFNPAFIGGQLPDAGFYIGVPVD